MNLHKEIKQAYQHIRVPDDVTERLKQELYQKDFCAVKREKRVKSAGNLFICKGKKPATEVDTYFFF